ncbi:MAG: Aspartyl-tRNA(Asn) amidotransferase subunit A @ Glutamyl-tRNA(Gln) amidotransferase subunit A, partial [uncultured Phycisphaerae bacterium]
VAAAAVRHADCRPRRYAREEDLCCRADQGRSGPHRDARPDLQVVRQRLPRAGAGSRGRGGRGEAHRPAGRAADRGQGQPVHDVRHDDLLVADAGELPLPVRRDRGAAAGVSRRGDRRQDEPRRVRHGQLDREQRGRPDPQPVGRRPRARRVVRRQRGRP